MTTTTYFYDATGNKVETQTTVSTNGGPGTTTVTDYIVAAENPSGYPQVLEEHGRNHSCRHATYILGENLIAQSQKYRRESALFPLRRTRFDAAADQFSGSDHRPVCLHGVRHADRI